MKLSRRAHRFAAPRSAAAALAALLLLSGCQTIRSVLPWGGSSSDHSDEEKELKIEELPPDLLYSNGVDALRKDSYSTAVRHFEAIQQNYPYSPWAMNAQLMEGYTEYRRNNYTEAVGQLDRFIQLHPSSKDVAYAYYLRALCFYEQIADISRDQKGTQEAMSALQEVVNRFPESAYARDARLKIDLCRDHLAGKEMAIGRYYEKQHLYAAAIGRYQRVVDDFQTTNHAPEALERLVEVYLKLGLVEEAKRTAAVLGYNYPGSAWYQTAWNDLVAVGAAQGSPSAVAAEEHPGFWSRTWGWIF
ncbi:MAG: outer membrane protein assembly factor BamD [Rhodospirillales bacterium]